MLSLCKKIIDLERSEILFSKPFKESDFENDWRVCCGEWGVKDGWLTGKNPENCAGAIISKADYNCDILLEFEARTVLPCTHDIDVMWNGCWDDEKNQRGVSYVMGVQGWWEGKVGFEKSPEYILFAATPVFKFEPGKIYNIKVGSINGACFVFIDNQLILEMTDTNPIDNSNYGKIGFEAYASHIQIRNLTVYKIAWEPYILKYNREV